MDIVQCGYQLLDGHLGWFHFLILTNKAAKNIFTQVLEWMLLFGKYPVVGCLDHVVDGCLSF